MRLTYNDKLSYLCQVSWWAVWQYHNMTVSRADQHSWQNQTSKVTIVKGHQWAAACGESTHTVAPCIHCLCIYVVPPCEWKRNGLFLRFISFGLKILPQLNIKAVHNFKTKCSGIVLTHGLCVLLCRPIFAFLLLLVSEVACGKELLIFGVLAYFGCFFCQFYCVVSESPDAK